MQIIRKNNSCRMGGPKKGQWVTVLLIRASTAGVCENRNLLPSEILPRFYLQTTLGNLFFYDLHQGLRKRIPIFSTRVTERISFSSQPP